MFYGGSRDGSTLDLFPASEEINLSHTVAGVEMVEVYRRTDEAIDGRTVLRWVGDRPDLLEDSSDDDDLLDD